MELAGLLVQNERGVGEVQRDSSKDWVCVAGLSPNHMVPWAQSPIMNTTVWPQYKQAHQRAGVGLEK